MPNLPAQLNLVQVYYAGSGARLNLSKSTVMALNRSTSCPRIPHMQTLARDASVKYLGLPFGQTPNEEATIRFLEDRLFDGFRLWYRRARTLRGRLLVALTMVLSRLWHYTVHVNVPTATVRRWQSMLNKFVLTRRYEPTSSHFQLIPKEFLYQRRVDGGLQIPSIEAQLKRQRLHLMQQFVAGTRAVDRNWTTPGVVLTRSILPPFCTWLPLDFLTISPYRHGTLVRWSALSKWWRQSSAWWQQVQWSVTHHDMEPENTRVYLLTQPIWLPVNPDLQYVKPTRQGTITPVRRSIGMVSEPHRSFRMHVARRFGLRSLKDFFGSGCEWPTSTMFVNAFLDYTLVSTPLYRQSVMLRSLYRELSQVVTRICPSRVAPTRVITEPVADIPYLGVATPTRNMLLPNIPRKLLLGLVWTPTLPTQPHPMTQHATPAPDPAEDLIDQFVRRPKRLRRLL